MTNNIVTSSETPICKTLSNELKKEQNNLSIAQTNKFYINKYVLPVWEKTLARLTEGFRIANFFIKYGNEYINLFITNKNQYLKALGVLNDWLTKNRDNKGTLEYKDKKREYGIALSVQFNRRDLNDILKAASNENIKKQLTVAQNTVNEQNAKVTEYNQKINTANANIKEINADRVANGCVIL